MIDHNTAAAIVHVMGALFLVVEPGMVIELRVLKVVDNSGCEAFSVSGYFDHNHLDELAKAAIELTGKAEGCYVTINPVNPDLLTRAPNRMIGKPKHTTTDKDIVRRIGLVFDADPRRPARVSSTVAEKALARDRIGQLVEHFTQLGWPAPTLIDSGNGYHARYKIDLANNERSLTLVKGVLRGASTIFSDDLVTIDTALSNASRIIKLPGTMARKGDSEDTRPHRRSEVISAPDCQVVPVEFLEKFAEEHTSVNLQPATGNGQPQLPWTKTVTSARVPRSAPGPTYFRRDFQMPSRDTTGMAASITSRQCWWTGLV